MITIPDRQSTTRAGMSPDRLHPSRLAKPSPARSLQKHPRR